MLKTKTTGALATACLVGASLLFSSSPAAALPPPPPNPSQQQINEAASTKAQAEAQVAEASAAVTQMTNQIESLNAQALAAADAYEMAKGHLEIAKQNQTKTADDLQTAAQQVADAEEAVKQIARQAYVQGNYSPDSSFLLDAEGPQELIDRINTLSMISESQAKDIEALKIAKVQQANADSAAKQAVVDTTEAEAATKGALEEMNAKVEAANAQMAALQAQKAQLDQQLAVAQEALFQLEGQAQTYQQWVAQKQAEEAAAAQAAAAKAAAEAAAAQAAGPTVNGNYARPAGGTFTSCFCPRWGTFHYGIDIANQMMTPIYAASSGTVTRAGFANGFGQAVYIQHDDGFVTVYGHVEAIYVSTGQRVSAGQTIAGMGTRGQSTGVHLHFEVTQGMYGTRIDPVPWLAARGIKV
ncbi:M23 family metallopeptidase [Blastococcus sp. Marseille-P5729]|uniref:M23 family metallopeptidase n=1 Tax=Blastococcus sp. Marseille-P5729 TaxID=2086582 RepID=UPI000D1021EF|nr:M23 family metallopeptidase [Blastococcus sp. Marseille-P5729]